MFEPALNCENNAIFKQIYSLKLFITFKMAKSSCFSLGEIKIFQISSKKSFITSSAGRAHSKCRQWVPIKRIPNVALKLNLHLPVVSKTFFKYWSQAKLPDWAIYWTMGNFLKSLATINLHKSPTFLVPKYITFLVKSFLGNFY